MIQIYTGNGKGKTTAALGLALRAAGAGKKVFIAQFVKGMAYSEVKALEKIPGIEIRQYGLDCFIKNEPTQKDIDAARRGLKAVAQIMAEEKYDMIILDEVNIATYYKLFPVEDLVSLLKNTSKKMEIVLTGRYAAEELLKMADLVTEMKEVRHYYLNGVEAREGIEF